MKEIEELCSNRSFGRITFVIQNVKTSIVVSLEFE